MTTSDRQLREAFVELADTLVDDYDIIDFLDILAQRVVDMLGVTACGIVLMDHHANLTLVAASTEQTRLLELFQLQNSEGPCYECHQTGVAVHSTDLRADDERWPRFAPAARASGYVAVHALPMRLRDTAIGAMNLFDEAEGTLDEEAITLAQALADVATIGILHERTVRQYETVTEQLQAALNSRIVIEQAKGVLAERLSISVDESFTIMRDHARSSNQKLRDVAGAVVVGILDPAWTRSGRPK